MKVLQIIPSLEARHGGPTRSVRALSRGLLDAGCDVTLLTTHDDKPAHIADDRLKILSFERARPHLLCPSGGLNRELALAQADVVHHHALWLRTLHYAQVAARRLGSPLVISPRGMMSPWAWKHRRWKKALAQRFVHPGALKAAAGWHATSAEEVADIRRLGFTQPVCMAPNGIAEPTPADIVQAREYWHTRWPESQDRPVAVFYSRFHRKKRVLDLIDLWMKVAPPTWQLLLVGIPQEYSVAELEDYVVRALGTRRIRVFDGINAPPPYAIASLFLLPSHSENFGLVIAEAMAHGLPVVVTDSTPWTAINAPELGWCVPWGSYAAALQTALGESPRALAARGEKARRWVLDHFSWKQSAAILADFYRSLK